MQATQTIRFASVQRTCAARRAACASALGARSSSAAQGGLLKLTRRVNVVQAARNTIGASLLVLASERNRQR